MRLQSEPVLRLQVAIECKESLIPSTKPGCAGLLGNHDEGLARAACPHKLFWNLKNSMSDGPRLCLEFLEYW